jgi:hypothetical protein
MKHNLARGAKAGQVPSMRVSPKKRPLINNSRPIKEEIKEWKRQITTSQYVIVPMEQKLFWETAQ